MLFGTVIFLGWADYFLNKDYESQLRSFVRYTISESFYN